MFLFNKTKNVLREYQIMPLRRRGQNFLINQNAIDKILSVADLKKDDIVLEIGAGIGSLTRELGKRAKRVVAVEIDKILVKILEQELKDFKNIKIIQEDIRKFNLKKNNLKKYKIVANVPFNITGFILKKFFNEKNKPELMVLIIQKEVAERIISSPPKMSLLSVIMQFYADVKLVSIIKNNNFFPRPKVDSALLILKLHVKTLVKNEDRFLNLVKAGFSCPRKYLLNNLVKSGMIKKKEGEKFFNEEKIFLKKRAQELTLNDWIKLSEKIK